MIVTGAEPVRRPDQSWADAAAGEPQVPRDPKLRR